MVFGSTIVVSGHGEAIVTDTGMNTKVGKIARLMIEEVSPETPLQKKLRRSREKVRINCNNYMFCNLFDWINKKNTS